LDSKNLEKQVNIKFQSFYYLVFFCYVLSFDLLNVKKAHLILNF